MNYLTNLNPFILTLLASLFACTITTLGSALVFFFKKINKTVLNIMLAFSSGIMLSSSFFSLLKPSIEMSNNLNLCAFKTLLIGFLFGSFLLYITGLLFNKLLSKTTNKESLKRSILIILSITIHNIPEGMAIGVAFASTLFNINGATIYTAIILSLGIAIQNFPEGSSISLPLRREGLSRLKSFLFGTLSGVIEIISAIIGYLLVLKIRILLPYLLSFAAGAMIYVVIEELIPESLNNNKKDLMALVSIIGFSIMMILDIALG